MNCAVSFDMDEVLVPSPLGQVLFPLIRRELAAGMAQQQGRVAVELEAEFRRRVYAIHRERLAAGDGVGAYDWEPIFNQVAAEMGHTEPVPLAALVAQFCQKPQAIPTYPEVPAALQRLQEQGIYLLVVTNGHRQFQQPLLEALDLSRYFCRVVTPEMAGAVKPSPAIFTFAFAGLPAEARWHVGDLLVHDVIGAYLAGMRTIWMVRNLPASLANLPPRWRQRSPDLLPYIQERFRAEGGDTWQTDWTPAWVVRDMNEAATIIIQETCKPTR